VFGILGATGFLYHALLAAAVLVMAANGLLAALSLGAVLWPRSAPPLPAEADLPPLSLLVPLYREAEIAPRLVRRLGRLDYPRNRLDVHLLLEADDVQTLRALRQAGLPPWMHVLQVPAGTIRTKPRALNYALPFCRGTIVGVFDAEDAPDTGMLLAVARRFHRTDPKVACLQGVLDFYNPRSNWLSRAFTAEYAAWFRVTLPGLARLGMPVPLGGTTLFFRREVLERIGGWDAHNVTEDADLGMRLFRRGYRTELIDSVTREEANCRPLPWARQRSRWIKGYMMTWRVHMQRPRRLWTELGPAGFLIFHILTLGSFGQAILGPVLMSVWLVAAGLPHPLAPILTGGGLLTLSALCLGCEALRLAVALTGLRRSGHGFRPGWALIAHLLVPLAFLAALKALWELLFRPFFWDKTEHGICESGSI
jgi:cellulose synthase/poly-beta-1,6-N-acetylglucosamine synthase-like glycosyltransferase